MSKTALRQQKQQKMSVVSKLLNGKWVKPEDITALLESLISPHDRLCLEGNNQKQALFLAKALCKVNPRIINNLHIVQSCLSLPEHIEIFERQIANRVDFCYSSGQASRIMNLAREGKVEVKGIHTYLEL